MRNQLKTVYGALALVAMFGLTGSAYGVPAFARQTGLDCNSCHGSAGYPTLSSFGAAFKAGGYTQANDDDLIGDGETLSLPKTLNLSLVYKGRAQVDVTSSGTTAELQNPDEFAILFGGKVAKNTGFLLEYGGEGPLSFKFVFAPELGPVRLGIVPWWTDALGAGYIFETLSTGAVRNIRSMENGNISSAQKVISWGGTNDQTLTGLGLYVWHPVFFATATPFWNGGGIGEAMDLATASTGIYARAAVTPSFGGMDLAVGVQYWGGASDILDEDTGTTSAVALNAIAADVQLMMNVGIPLSAFVTFATDIAQSNTSLNIAIDAAVIPDVLMLDLASRIDLNAGGAKTGIGLGAKYHIFRNVKAEVDVAFTFASGDIQILPMIFAAF